MLALRRLYVTCEQAYNIMIDSKHSAKLHICSALTSVTSPLLLSDGAIVQSNDLSTTGNISSRMKVKNNMPLNSRNSSDQSGSGFAGQNTFDRCLFRYLPITSALLRWCVNKSLHFAHTFVALSLHKPCWTCAQC
jgi:hypothetical protein